MIREIAAQSGGAQIKVLSDKEKEREMHETAVLVSGKLEHQADAVSIIVEKIATFRFLAKASSES